MNHFLFFRFYFRLLLGVEKVVVTNPTEPAIFSSFAKPSGIVTEETKTRSQMANRQETVDDTESVMDFSLLNDDFLLSLDNNYGATSSSVR